MCPLPSCSPGVGVEGATDKFGAYSVNVQKTGRWTMGRPPCDGTANQTISSRAVRFPAHRQHAGVAEDVAQIMLVYFPGSRASMKDKQYYEDMSGELLRIEQRNREKSQPAR
jgi:hypothetical protein